MHRSTATTHGIRVDVESVYVQARSRPADGQWFFEYTVTLTNESDQTVQLMTRHWVITDSDGRSHEVRGPGVVGKQPVLHPGESFEYRSFCPLNTAFGMMHGSYQMVRSGSGDAFDVEIAPFALGEPHALN